MESTSARASLIIFGIFDGQGERMNVISLYLTEREAAFHVWSQELMGNVFNNCKMAVLGCC
eukprot:scaffold630408_cov36-Prasinocladus_malaysianus.AAC.1